MMGNYFIRYRKRRLQLAALVAFLLASVGSPALADDPPDTIRGGNKVMVVDTAAQRAG